VVDDPQRASFVLFRAANPGPDQPPPGLLGRIGWHELYATDWAQALAFYRALFGWQQAEAIDLGAMGTYQTFSVGGETIGGMFNKPPAIPATFWLFYVNVDDIDAALARVTAAGGQILNGPMQVPGGDWIIQAQDPQGAMFALVGKRAA
jgi:predicted enzyme related to lactoylglutathione lyase